MAVRSLVSFIVCVFALITGCSEKETSERSEIFLSSSERFQSATTTGNLVTTAMREIHDLDIVLYPSALLDPEKFAYIKPHMAPEEIDAAVNIYPQSTKDQFYVGVMKGSDIKKLIIERSEEIYGADLQVAGLHYDVRFTGGSRTIANVVFPDQTPFDLDRRYRIAISNVFYFNGRTLPGYIYRNGLNFSFRKTRRSTISARKAVRAYLEKMEFLPRLFEPRATVRKFVRGDLGRLKTYEIQGEQHHSPHYGYRVQTEGVVTAMGLSDFYPSGIDVFIQDPQGDNNPRTSDGLHVYLGNINKKIKVGDFITVTGVVYEQWTRDDLTRTSLRDIDEKDVHIKGQRPLPAPVVLGIGGRPLPDRHISTFQENLNLKWNLNLDEGIDFWESLESMRVQINNPKVVGFSGGKEKAENNKNGAKGYLNLFVRPDGDKAYRKETAAGGVYIESESRDYNPMLVNLATHHLTKGISTDTVFNVGDIIQGKIVGLVNFEKSFFGQGQYTLLMPQAQEALSSLNNKEDTKDSGACNASYEKVAHKIVCLSHRPKTKLKPQGRQLTVATYNVENLAGYQTERLKDLGETISHNLSCPDIINLVEIQDFDGIGFSGSTSARRTLNRIIGYINCPGAQYAAANVDPYLHGEGGQPGGNIRVSILYNKNRVGFNSIPNNDPLAETIIARDGSLSHNPGRVYPNAKAFERTRKSLVAEFNFQGERVIVIGNHFNSKLGDRSLWGAQQPISFDSEVRRSRMANEINHFVQRLAKLDPRANIIVAGDFNAYFVEQPMKILEGDVLTNLMTYGNLIPVKERYTTNYQGNSQALDYIFVNRNLLNKKPEAEVLHINSDYMGRYSDHDPVISRFTF